MIEIGTVILLILILIRVKSGNFRHQVNSDIPLQTVEIQMRWLLYEPSHQDFHCLPSLSIFLFQ